jgi:hypothetical protein
VNVIAARVLGGVRENEEGGRDEQGRGATSRSVGLRGSIATWRV